MSKIRWKKVQQDGHRKKWPFFFAFVTLLFMQFFLLIFITLHFQRASAAQVPLSDNLLFAFERCKELTVDLEKGLLKESSSPSFDLYCSKSKNTKSEFACSYFDTGSNKKIKLERFEGGSDLGIAELTSKEGIKIKFLIGKKFASYAAAAEQKVCAGIFIFEQDALKQKASSLKSGL